MKDYIAVDVDGHIMEPPDIFENNLEPKYRDRAYKLVEDDAGVEHPVMDNIWLDDTRPVGTVSVYGAVDKPMEDYLAGKVHYRDSMVPGAWVPEERLKVMDEEGIDIALFYPSLGLDWESSSDDADLVAAHCRVYNDWLIDFCSTDPSRLVPIAHISFMDVEQAVAETRRVVGLGAKGLMLLAFPPRNGSPYGEPTFDPIWAEAESLGLPVGCTRSRGRDPVWRRLLLPAPLEGVVVVVVRHGSGVRGGLDDLAVPGRPLRQVPEPSGDRAGGRLRLAGLLAGADGRVFREVRLRDVDAA